MIRRLLLWFVAPVAWWWAGRQESVALATGAPLDACAVADARRAGVARPERVRVRVVDDLPWPGPLWLRKLAQSARLAPQDIVGVSLGYGIWLCADVAGDRALLAHELVHVAQHERLGGLRAFLGAYLAECLTGPGYPAGVLEQEALRFAHSIRSSERVARRA
jgi:hypothetical protein